LRNDPLREQRLALFSTMRQAEGNPLVFDGNKRENRISSMKSEIEDSEGCFHR